uniref:Cytochrome b561 domain-containing protein n=1 Tax=Helobdella robusta TaxID=6412 RepID=T1FX12_HELRO
MFGVLLVILISLWMAIYHGGFEWYHEKAFNFHPLFMVLGMVFFYAEAILVYRVFRNKKKIVLKLFHASLNVLAFIFGALGLKAVFDSHNLIDKPIPNLYSLHSWLGITTVVLFAVQWLFGLFGFLLPVSNLKFKKILMPIHLFFGIVIFVLATLTSLTGLTEKALWTLDKTYQLFVPEGVLINVMGLLLVIFCISIVFLVVNPNYKRVAKAEDGVNLIN